MKRICEHEGEDKCVHCGIEKSKWDKQSCQFRDAVRSIPTSIFKGDITGIGERAREIAISENLWKTKSD